jgi:glutathione S-transferase
MDLYGHPWSAPTREVRILCTELGVAYRLVEMNRAQDSDYLPEALNPACRIPMIDDDGIVLGEAHAIMRYLVARHAPGGAWYPAELAARAAADQWLDWQALRLGPLAATLARERLFAPGGPDAGAVERAQGLLARILPELEVQLRDRPYLGGAHPTLADIAVYTSLDYLRLASFDPSGFHAMFRWYQSFHARDACATTAHAGVTAGIAAV